VIDPCLGAVLSALLAAQVPASTAPGASVVLVPLPGGAVDQITSVDDGVRFDHDADGTSERTAWTAAGARVAFLAIDRNGNGTIDDGTELLGRHTVAGARYGIDALDKLNQKMGGGEEVAIIDESQPVFSRLLLWEDANHNGTSEPHELQQAASLLSGIGLGLVPQNRKDAFGNRFALRGFAHVRTAPGVNAPQSAAEDRERTIQLADVVLVTGK